MTVQPAAAGPRIPEWDLSDRLRKLRRDSGMGQREFAAQLDVKWQRYAAWESGRNRPDNLVAIAQRLELLTGVPATWTLGLELPTVGGGSSGVTDTTTKRYVSGSSSSRRLLSLVQPCSSDYTEVSAGPGAVGVAHRPALRVAT